MSPLPLRKRHRRSRLALTEMNLGDAVKRCRPLGRADHLRRHELGLADQLFYGHRYMLVPIASLERFNIRRTRVNYNEFHSSHFSSPGIRVMHAFSGGRLPPVAHNA